MKSPAIDNRESIYLDVRERISALLDAKVDWIAAMATVACELQHAFDYFHWTGFYRNTNEQTLLVGPYQGDHGCLTIQFDRGVCGAAATTKETQLVDNVDDFPDHIACSSSTASEIVVPIVDTAGNLLAVLDVDSNFPAAFNAVDQVHLEELCDELGRRFG